MSGDFFDQLDAELAELTREGAHLCDQERSRCRRGRLLRRGAVSALVVVAMAVSLVSEFPASASGRAQATSALAADRL
jgi:hypothetical protein